MTSTKMMLLTPRIDSKRPKPSDSIYLLEILRFISCLGVLLYHYQHFIVYRGDTYDSKVLPLQVIFSWFYTNGDSGVQVFWCLSGIVFAHVYQSALIEKTVSTLDFVWRRFARLYPLHVVTLVLVSILQWSLKSTTDLPYFIYQFNNIKHFALNIIFANYWGFQDGTSFNGPVWSISIELIAYSIFLAVTVFVGKLPRIFRSPLMLLVLWSGMLWYCTSRLTTPSDFILDCVALFVLGVIVYSSWVIFPNCVIFMIILYLVVSYRMNDSVSRSLELLGIPFTSMMIAVFIALLHFSSLFSRLRFGRFLATNLGKITYAMYMVHFPIQLLMVLFSETFVRLDFASKHVFFFFFSLTLLISYLCYQYFELPVQRALRNWFSNLKS